MANKFLQNFLMGGLTELQQRRQQQIQQNQQLELMYQQLKLKEKMADLQSKSQIDLFKNLMNQPQAGGQFQQFQFGQPGQQITPQQVQGVPIQQPQFINQPGLSIGPAGTTVSLSRIPNPAVARSIQERTTRFTNAGQLRKELTSSPVIKDFRAIQAQVNQMDALVTQAADGALNINNALDQALITTFNKINDPGSVVRESEFARTSQNLPVTNRILGALQKFTKGGAGLTKEDRLDLVKAAKIIANERGKLFNDELDRFNNLADEFTVRRSLVTGGFKRFSPIKTKVKTPPPVPISNNRLIQQKIKRANEISRQNPNLNKQQIINMINLEFGG